MPKGIGWAIYALRRGFGAVPIYRLDWTSLRRGRRHHRRGGAWTPSSASRGGSAVMITIELTEDEALSLRNLLDLAVPHEGMRAAIFAVTLDAKKLGKGHTQNPVSGGI